MSSPLTPPWREMDSNFRSLSYDQYPNGLKKAPELCAHGQPRCVRTREVRGRSRYSDNRMVRRGPMSCPNALPKPCAPRMRLVGRTTELTTVGRRCSSPIVINCLPTSDRPPIVPGDRHPRTARSSELLLLPPVHDVQTAGASGLSHGVFGSL